MWKSDSNAWPPEHGLPYHPCSRKRHELWIPRPPIRTNIVLRKPLFRVNPPSFIKSYAPAPHDLLDLSLRLLIQTGSGVRRRDIGGQIKVAGGEARLHVSSEGAWEAVVNVVGDG